MLKYATATNTLVARKLSIHEPTPKLTAIQTENYARYKANIHKDIAYLEEQLNRRFAPNRLSLKLVKTKDVGGTRVSQDVDYTLDSYKPISVDITYNDTFTLNDVNILKLPSMDDQGILNINGSRRCLLNSLSLAKALHYDKNERLQLMGADRRSLSFHINSARTEIIFRDSQKVKLSVYDIARVLLYEEGLELGDYFSNLIFANYANKNYFRQMEASEIKMNSIFKEYYRDIYVSPIRDSLNNHLSLQKAVGLVLAKDVEEFSSGTIITKSIVDMLIARDVVSIFVRYKPPIAGYYLRKDILIDKIPAGTQTNEYLLQLYPELEGCAHVPQDIKADIILASGTKIDMAILDLLFSVGIDSIWATKARTTKECHSPIPFQMEIISNCLDQDEDKLGNWDILSLINFTCGCVLMPEVFRAPDRDEDFLKEIDTINEILHDVFRKTTASFIRGIHHLANSLQKPIPDRDRVYKAFEYFNVIFYRTLNETKLLRPADYTNPLSVVSQASRVATITQSKHTTVMEMRLIPHGHNGVIDPWDTPQGQKLGLVTSLTLNSKLGPNNVLMSPHYKVVHKGGKCYLSDEVVYLTSAQRAEYRVANIMDLEWETGDNPDVHKDALLNKLIIAEIPVTYSMDETQTYSEIFTNELDYVSSYSNQHVSVATSMIPFLGANEGARISFTTSMLRQAIETLYNEKPRVYTPIYRHIVEETGSTIRSTVDGTVADITASRIIVTDAAGGGYTHNRSLSNVRNGSLFTLDTKVRLGQKVKKGQILAETSMSKDGVMAIGVNGFTAYMPWKGYNFEDGVVMSNAFTEKMISPTINRVSETAEIDKISKKIPMYDAKRTIGKYVREGDQVFQIKKFKNGSRVEDIVRAKMGKSGFLYNINVETNGDDSKSFTAELLDLNSPGSGDKFSNRHGNKGVQTIREKNSAMPYFSNGVLIDVVNNPLGVDGRMNMGQLLEGAAGFCAYLFDFSIETECFNGMTTEEIRLLLSFLYDVANMSSVDAAIRKHPEISDDVKELARQKQERIRDWKGCFNRDGSAYLINPETGMPYGSPVFIGYTHYLKLHHEVVNKRHERGGFGRENYMQVYKSPTKGSAQGGGQKYGEMEVWALEAYGASNHLTEALNLKSDNVYMRHSVNNILDTDRKRVEPGNVGLRDEDIVSIKDTRPRSLELFLQNLEAFGYSMDLSEVTNLSNTLQCINENARSLDVYDSVDDTGNFDEISEMTSEMLFGKWGGE